MRSGSGLRRSCRLLVVVVVSGPITGGWCRASCTGFGRGCHGGTCRNGSGRGRPAMSGIAAGQRTEPGARSWTNYGSVPTWPRARIGRSGSTPPWCVRTSTRPEPGIADRVGSAKRGPEKGRIRRPGGARPVPRWAHHQDPPGRRPALPTDRPVDLTGPAIRRHDVAESARPGPNQTLRHRP
jgi:hypothetical protein